MDAVTPSDSDNVDRVLRILDELAERKVDIMYLEVGDVRLQISPTPLPATGESASSPQRDEGPALAKFAKRYGTEGKKVVGG